MSFKVWCDRIRARGEEGATNIAHLAVQLDVFSLGATNVMPLAMRESRLGFACAIGQVATDVAPFLVGMRLVGSYCHFHPS